MFCQELKPVVGRLQTEFPQQFRFRSYDFDVASERQEAVEKYGLTVHPAFAFVDRNGVVIDRSIGPIPESDLRQRLVNLIQSP